MKNKKRWTLVLVMLAFFSLLSFTDRVREVKADDIPVEEIKPYKTPTDDVRKFLGIWMTSGYALQPKDYSYTKVDSPVTLYTDQARSFVTALLTLTSWAHYQWYETSGDGKWKEVSKKNGGTKKNLTLTPTEIGTKYYQQETSWYMVISALSPTVYSKVAAVKALDKHVYATDLDITLDDDYIYNYESKVTTTSTYAHATVTPADFTGTIKWSIDCPDLATIDPDSGFIQANPRTKSGIATVTATALNADGTTVSKDKEITIGGGLEDQTVKAGDDATFELMGNIGEFEEEEGLNYTIRWFKEDPITHQQEEVDAGKNSTSYTIPKTTLNDDGTLVYAVISVQANGGPYEYTTNEAMLHVIPEGGPQISLEDTIENKTFNSGSDTNTELYDVNKGDNVIYHSVINNHSTGGSLMDATYTLPLRKDTVINGITLDGRTLTEDEYQTSVDEESGNISLVVNLPKLGMEAEHDLDVDTKVGDVSSRESYRTTAYIKGKDDSGNDSQKIGATRSLNLTTGILQYSIAKIDYGTIKPINNQSLIRRQNDASNWPDNMIDIDDMRRNKSAVSLYVTQKGDFVNGNQDVLQGRLKYVDDDEEQDLMTGSAMVSETQNNQEMKSLSWKADEGVLLAMDNNKMNSGGAYKTELQWDLIDSV